MQIDGGRGLYWAGLPMIATVARLLCREVTLENAYLREENRILKDKAREKGRLRFTDDERRCLVEAALALGRSLLKEVVTIVQPETILAWQRRLEKQKWDYSHRRRKPGRPAYPSRRRSAHLHAGPGEHLGATSGFAENCSSSASSVRKAVSQISSVETDSHPPRGARGSPGSSSFPGTRKFSFASTSLRRKCGPAPDSERPTSSSPFI